MPTAILIKNPTNNNILRCKHTLKNVNLALINGKNMRGISVPYTSVLERTPAYDLFVKSALNSGFTQEHINNIFDTIIIQTLKDIVNEMENDDSHEDYGLKENYFKLS